LAVGFMSFPLVRRLQQVFDTFGRRYPRVQLRWREVTFPLEDGLAWLDDADVALSVCPVEHPAIRAETLSSDPRVVIAGVRHPLAQRSAVRVDDILDETFPGVDNSVARAWAASWYLDRRRGRPARTTDDTTKTLPEAAAVVASGAAVCTTADVLAREYEGSSIAVVPLVDAEPALVTLSWEEENLNPLIEALVALAREMTSEGTASSPS
jgi:DNA-binding transcriptional LysR family regulator